MIFPDVKKAKKLNDDGKKRLLIAAYGSEQRTMGWTSCQKTNTSSILTDALMIYYSPTTKGANKIRQLKKALKLLGAKDPKEIKYNVYDPDFIENRLEDKLKIYTDYNEIIVDITSLTKYLILIILCKLTPFKGKLRIVYTEPKDYAPSQSDYENYKINQSKIAKFPNYGAGTIQSAQCLGSIRMQGQPVCLIAFTSFNEQLIRYILGSLNPYRLYLINGRPPHEHFSWRENATQFIHEKIIKEFERDNPIDKRTGKLQYVSSTLYYQETIKLINKFYKEVGLRERIVASATGSKMQTVGLFFSKIMHLDIHVEYPTPDSWFLKNISIGIKQVHEIEVPFFSKFIEKLAGRKIQL